FRPWPRRDQAGDRCDASPDHEPCQGREGARHSLEHEVMKRLLPGFRMQPCVAALLIGAALCVNCRAEPAEELSGGEGTVFDDSRNAFSFPAANLSLEHRTRFFVGNSFFNQNWVAAPATPAARDGLGPLFVTRSCSACHFKDGRSGAPESGAFVETMAV